MSYPPNQGGYYGGPPPNQPPAGGPPPGQYIQHYQQQYQQHQQQQQQPWGQGPPPQQPPQHHGGNWGQGPGPQGFQAPQQPPLSNFQHNPSFGGPPPTQHAPPPQGYPGQGFNAAPSYPSPGYDPNAVAQGDATRDADALRSAMKGFGTDEKALVAVLSKPDPLQMGLLRQTFSKRHSGRSLERDVEKETSGYFKEGLLALIRGPLMQDVHNAQKSIKGLGTKESVMNDVLLGRTNADMRAIKQAYHHTFKHTIEDDVKSDLSLKTERLFSMVLAANRAEESTPIYPQDIDRFVNELHHGMEGRVGTDQVTVCSILSSRSDGQIRSIAHAFNTKYHITLEKTIENEFSGHMKDALLLIVQRACDKAMSDAVQLEDSMKGIGTKDDLLVNRVVRVHWDRSHMDQVKRAYQHRYKKSLIDRIRGETKGDQERLLVACLT
ncbi:MAG: hypothetical protein Q9160_006475 [Pyrenula sp. 1 TL-2023]